MSAVEEEVNTFLSGFREMVKAVLGHRHMSERDLARAMNSPEYLVLALLDGSSHPRLSTVVRVAHALDCTPDITFDPYEDQV